MNLEADIRWIAKELREVKDPVYIEFIKNILRSRKENSLQERTSIEMYNTEIDEAEKDIEAGNFYTSKEVEEMMQQWGRK